MPAHASGAPGADSELYLVEQALARKGLGRAAAETVTGWLARIGAALPAGCDGRLREVALLHYRYRFDPAGLPATERAVLRERAHALLQAVERAR